MCYDNSELLKNYVHAYQVTGSQFFDDVARDIIRWMDEWLSDREHGGFYASQDADYSMDDDGDYFTWTVAETRAALSPEEAQVAMLYYDINEVGEMHHNPAKNVLYVQVSIDEIAKRLSIAADRVQELLASAKKKMYAARLERDTPYVDKTVYVGWNALCISAYLDAAKTLGLEEARRFALRSLDRIISEGLRRRACCTYWRIPIRRRSVARCAACWMTMPSSRWLASDAYETSADLSYFKFARRITDAMVDKFFDPTSGGFFDTEKKEDARSNSARSRPAENPFRIRPPPPEIRLPPSPCCACTDTPTSRAIATRQRKRWKCLRVWQISLEFSERPTESPESTSRSRTLR